MAVSRLHPYHSGELHFFLLDSPSPTTRTSTASSSQIRDFQPLPPPTASESQPPHQQQAEAEAEAQTQPPPPRNNTSPQRFNPPSRIARRSIFRARQTRRATASPNLWNPLNTSSNAFELPTRPRAPPPASLTLTAERARPRNLSETNPRSPLLASPQETRNTASPNSLLVEAPTTPTTALPSIGIPSSARVSPSDPKGKGKAPVYEPPLLGKTSRPQPRSDSPSLSGKSLPPLPMASDNPSQLSLPTVHQAPSLPAKDTPRHSGDGYKLSNVNPIPHAHHKTFPSTTTDPSQLEAGTSRPPSPAPSLPWNDRHPCFPHPNTHVPLSSPLYPATKIIRIPRDWMSAGDLAPQFSNTYPEILAPWVSEEEFRTLLGKVNEGLQSAVSPWGVGNVVDAMLGVLSGWLWEDAGVGRSKSRVKAVEQEIDSWNSKKAAEKRGAGGEEELVRVVELRKSGFMSLDFQIPDPKIGMLGADASSAKEDEQSAQLEAERPDTADVGGSGGGTF
ncbi:hypothetical protein MMC30_005385 [Trapelia coarctata]|nr:hypothetical protein [Trapelia coarctata]